MRLLTVIHLNLLLWSLAIDSGCRRDELRLVRVQLEVLGSKLEDYARVSGRLPNSLDLLTKPASDGLGPYARERDLLDPWGRPLYYRVAQNESSFVLFTLGADGRVGGEGAAADQEFVPDVELAKAP